MLHPEDDESMQKALSKMEDLKAWDIEAKIKEILFKLNITELEQEVGESVRRATEAVSACQAID